MNPLRRALEPGILWIALLFLASCSTPLRHSAGHPHGQPRPIGVAQDRKSDDGLPYPMAQAPQVETLIHVPTGLPLQPTQLAGVISGARVVYVGETHDNAEAHRAQAELVELLVAQHGRNVVIALEMFRTPQQPVLDRWSRGELSDLQFLRQLRWAEGWGGDFALYRPVLERAQRHKLDVLALNPSDELQKAVRNHGWAGVPEPLRRDLPERGPDDPWQLEQLKAVFGAHAADEARFEKMWRIQMLWEEHMAQRLAQYLASPQGKGKVALVIAGGWHVRYGFGVPKKLMRRMALPYLVIGTEEISGSADDTADRHMAYRAPPLPLYPADVLWWLPLRTLDKAASWLGIRVRDAAGAVEVLHVDPQGPAAAAGLAQGATLTAVDGEALQDRYDVLYLRQRKKPGETMVLSVVGPQGPAPITVKLAAPPEESEAPKRPAQSLDL